jgi:eukaryotic-like serine/threonine-protein kinase
VRQTPIGTPQTAFAQTGSMVYVASAAQQQDETELVWISRSGAEEPTSISGVGFQMPRVSPDGSRVIVAASRGGTASIGTVGDLWMYDLTRNTRSRLTFNGASSFPIWAPDGTRLAYSSGQTGQFQIHLKPFGVGTSEELLSSDRGTNYPLSWSRDGRYLASVSVDTKTFNDIWVADVSDHPTWRPFVQTPFREGAPTFSHDGRWIAYASEQSGRSEIYMRPFPGPGEEWTISPDGGTEPLWAKTAGQLFYLHGNEMMVVDINTGPPVTASRPRRLFEKPYTRSSGFWPNYDVAGDGQRFLMVKGKAEEAPPHINVVLNWQEELKQRVPTR